MLSTLYLVSPNVSERGTTPFRREFYQIRFLTRTPFSSEYLEKNLEVFLYKNSYFLDILFRSPLTKSLKKTCETGPYPFLTSKGRNDLQIFLQIFLLSVSGQILPREKRAVIGKKLKLRRGSICSSDDRRFS